MIGVNLQLFGGFDGTIKQADLSDIQALWWDVIEPKDMQLPIGKTTIATTDENGYINLDLSDVTSLSIGGSGFLALYKLDDVDHEASPIFSGKTTTSDIVSGIDMFDSGWERPTDWPVLDALVDGVEKAQGVYAIYDIETAGNGIALICEGDYHVDWGDGSNEDVASGVTVEHSFDFSNVNLSEITSEGYKCAVITITPQDGSHLTKVDFGTRHSIFDQLCLIPWLDIVINSSYLTTLNVSGPNVAVLLEQFIIGQCGDVSGYYLFEDCKSLQSVKISNLDTLTSLSRMFYGCTSLQSIRPFDFSSMGSMSLFATFEDCYSLRSVKLINVTETYTLSDTFNGCYGLQSVLISGSSSLNMSHAFEECYSLQSISIIGCTISSMSYMFYNCYSLQVAPWLDTSAVRYMSYTFYGCRSLQLIPLYDTSIVVYIDYAFRYCTSLITIPLFDFSKITNSDYAFRDCPSLKWAKTLNMTCYFSLTDCSLDPEALNAVYTGLGTVTDTSISVTGNWGTGSDDPSIATAKGWTVQ